MPRRPPVPFGPSTASSPGSPRPPCPAPRDPQDPKAPPSLPPPLPPNLPPSLHGTAVALGDRGVILLGPPGSGKSDLALRLIGRGARLIADDRVVVAGPPGPPLASAPPPLAGLLEVRGLGILPLAAAARVDAALPLVLAVRLLPPGHSPERLPDPATIDLAGHRLPCLALAPFEASAVDKLWLALAGLGADSGAASHRPPPLPDSPAMVVPPVSPPSGPPPPPDAPRPGSTGRRRLVVVTGMSGAGRSTVLRALEDMGYEAVDNPPLHLLDALVLDPGADPRPLALGVDSRTRGFDVATVVAALDRLEAHPGHDTRMVFVDCEDAVLVRRYTETRRRHPLAVDRPLKDGISLERRLVGPLMERAFLRLDTSTLPPGRLKSLLEEEFALQPQPDMAVFLTSFGFRNGLPREADLVFDVRFLDNPHYDPRLRSLTGQDAAVAAFVEADPDWAAFFTRITDLLDLLLPRYAREGKSYLTIAIGCTGGRHRSVYTTERLAAWLTQRGVRAHATHRDLGNA